MALFTVGRGTFSIGESVVEVLGLRRELKLRFGELDGCLSALADEGVVDVDTGGEEGLGSLSS